MRQSSDARRLHSLRSAKSTEQRETRLSQLRSLQSSKLHEETADALLGLLEGQRIRYTHIRATETDRARDLRLADQRFRTLQRRAAESAAET